MTTQFQIAQVNIGRIRAPLDDPLLAGFVANLEGINGLADSSPGFVWRLKTDAGDATSLRPYDDDHILVNLSVWATPEDLREFVYRSAHAGVMRQRKSWFERFDGMYYALWWVTVGHIPSIDEAKSRLEYLRAHGESAHVFSFAKLFPAPGSSVDGPVVGFADPCPVA
jgi:heme-degrading monooxygenase HmoA